MPTLPATHVASVPGAMLERGFWLYVWRVRSAQGEFLYVGRTGDSSSPFATEPYRRFGQHLGHQVNQNALRRHLESNGIAPEQCSELAMIAHGPLFPQATDMDAHVGPRDTVAALERELASALQTVGYDVLNTVHCKMT